MLWENYLMKWLENISERLGRIVGRFCGGRDAARVGAEINELARYLVMDGFCSHGECTFTKVEGDIVLTLKPEAGGCFRISACPLWREGTYMWSRFFRWRDFCVDDVKVSLAAMRAELTMRQREGHPIN